jgi:hypothetical protein
MKKLQTNYQKAIARMAEAVANVNRLEKLYLESKKQTQVVGR